MDGSAEEREAEEEEEEEEGEAGGGHFLNDQTNKTLRLV